MVIIFSLNKDSGSGLLRTEPKRISDTSSLTDFQLTLRLQINISGNSVRRDTLPQIQSDTDDRVIR